METFGGFVLHRAFSIQDDACVVPDFAERLTKDVRTQGYLRAVLRSIRKFLDVDQSDLHRRLSEANVPTLTIWGADDPVIPISVKAKLEAANPKAQHVVLDGADHDLPHKNPDQVLAAIK